MFCPHPDPEPADIEALSPLERDVWHEKQKRGSNLEVALKLCLSEEAVKRHLQSIAQKMRDWWRKKRRLNGLV